MINRRNDSMKLNTAIITLITFFTSTVLLANSLGLGDNGDGTWNVLDIVNLVNCILANNCDE